jgi:hypothetical protein
MAFDKKAWTKEYKQRPYVKKSDKEYRNRPETKLKRRSRYLKNREKILNQEKERYIKNKDHIKDYNKEYRERNRDTLLPKKREYSQRPDIRAKKQDPNCKEYWSSREGLWKKQGVKNADGSWFKRHDFEVLVAQQNSKCAGCNTYFENKENLVADHNHVNGIVRGLLCKSCNHTLGFAKDSIEILKNLSNYLESKNK